MTLILGIAAPWGMWQSSDHRLLELPSGKHVSNASMKHLGVKTVDGAALISYTGIGRIGKEDMSDWLRKTLRGEDRPLELTAQEIADRATGRFAAMAAESGVLHVFVMSAYLRGEPFVVGIANSRTPLAATTMIEQQFSVTPVKVTKPVPVFAGGGMQAVTDADRDLLRQASKKRPRRPEDFQRLLAEVNKRAADSGHQAAAVITSGCLTSHLSPDGRISSTFFGPTLEEAEHVIPPFLLQGVDTTEIADSVFRIDPSTGRFVGGEIDEGALRRSVRPEE